MKYALTNGVIYTAKDVLYGYAVVVENGIIQAVVRQTELASGLAKIDLQGNNLTAGFIDLQLNGCGGVMFNEEPTVRTLEIMQQTNLRSGTTSFLPTFITAPDEDMKHAVQTMRAYLATHQNQALGLHLEGPYLSLEKKGVHRAEYVRTLSPAMKQFLLDNADVISKITLAAENPAVEAIPEFVQKGIVVSIGHSNATYPVAKQAFAKGASFATHLHNAMSPISSGRAMGVVGAVLDSDDVYAGIIVDGLHVEFGNIKIAKRAKGNKLCIVTDSTAAAGAQIEQFTFVGKTVYVRDGKCVDANGTLGGASITMIESIKNAVEQVGISLAESLRMCNYYPAQAIGVADKLGSIEVGKIANLTAFNHRFEVVASSVNGEWYAFN
ncbi:N-acetylglucosamine-6-phosphate deacetylase [[Haemophilus] ducreyi]|uniref:N-acetylglucosamine-6-phosphate deacetylase n=1 Tax=Haemophilus ducreyi TaxID=730 RepID=UPI000655030A|nr:N-acetylglucosamine-6-phosphate deacetylase [[Haemophilus] ducreyi]AKO45915.1 N-acetylglucosamine-6-phosphate deacetylase [[Haemophilus] ducreyi]AKO47275.1 N-acetylglucosamine-6-phosphate deacetylase [[Haemophilus] ducreyi]AKO48639.1 N-acetylglucosamine-6-phosphate deacetylase [[Haemophilus] ducreyi]AKO50010.1 N-acetylglucosamine-6-phosphate deacetylase [[Haemophilus] ducreyi]ANF61922.1 N-acetylglucosamine-6-phosphate deacetylase [[Haemophilus] ducreyi]